MTRTMRMLLRLIAVLALTLGLAGSASAQKGDAQDDQQQGDGTITKTFELTLNGEVPAGQSFYAQYIETDASEDLTRAVLFCGELIEEEPKDACEGNGAVYTETVTFDAGTEIEFRFGRHNLDYTDIEVFHEGTEMLDAHTTHSAFFSFDGGKTDDGQDDDGAGDAQDEQQMPSVPQTGAGGVAGGDFPLGGVAAVAPLLAGGWCATPGRR